MQSVYFDDPDATAFFEKLDGIEKRRKYRIRYYNNDLSYVRLEKKEKIGNLCRKTSERIDAAQAERFCLAEPDGAAQSGGLIGEFSHLILRECYRPLLFLSYQRKAFVYPAGNVRITLDFALSAGRFSGNLLNPTLSAIPFLDGSQTILEVKFDSFLPPFISELMEDVPKQICAISKFCKGVEALY